VYIKDRTAGSNYSSAFSCSIRPGLCVAAGYHWGALAATFGVFERLQVTDFDVSGVLFGFLCSHVYSSFFFWFVCSVSVAPNNT
jgi:hypothetical protein